MSTRRLYLSIMGTMGSGKTTVARLLSRELKFHLLEEHFGENPFLPRFYRNMERWAFHSQAFFLMEKIDQMRETPTLLETQSVVQDTPIQQDVFSYAKAQHVLGNIDDAQWRLYLKIYRSFEPYLPRPDLIVYLETPVPILADRIEKRGRGFEQKIPQRYIELLDMLNHTWLSGNKTIPVLTIQTDGLNVVRSAIAQKQLIQQVKQTLK